jgi:hypothetical protein
MSAENAVYGLLGAAIGAAGAVISSFSTMRSENKKFREERKDEREKDLRNLVARYLVISQDIVESLWHRFKNIKEDSGRSYMGEEYYASTTLFSLARFFAIKQIMILEGAYSSIEFAYPSVDGIETGLGVYIQNKFEAVDKIIDDSTNQLDGTNFYRYYRLQLGEAVMEREDGQWIISKLLDFRSRYYTNSNVHLPDFLEYAKEFVMAEKLNTFGLIMDQIQAISHSISKVTRLPSSIRPSKS